MSIYDTCKNTILKYIRYDTISLCDILQNCIFTGIIVSYVTHSIAAQNQDIYFHGHHFNQ